MMPARFHRFLLTRLLPTFALVSLAACGLPSGDMFTYPADSPELANASVREGVWESVPWEGSPWLPYPPQATVQLEHGLGYVPRSVLVYVSFEESGVEPAPTAGDLSRIIEVDDTFLTVRNDTNAVLFARVVAY